MAGGASNPMKREENKTAQRRQISPSAKMRRFNYYRQIVAGRVRRRWIELFKGVEMRREGH